MTQQATDKLSIFQRILLATSAILFIILVLAQMVPLSYGSGQQYIAQASLQLTRSNAFAKNVLILQHGPPDKQTQALSDLQVALPLFVGQQSKVQRNSDQSIQSVLQEAQSNYLALVVAVTAIVNHTDSAIDSKQVLIIVENSRTYNLVMSRYLSILQQQASDLNAHLVLFQEVATGLIGGCFVCLHIIGMGRLKAISKRVEA